MAALRYACLSTFIIDDFETFLGATSTTASNKARLVQNDVDSNDCGWLSVKCGQTKAWGQYGNPWHPWFVILMGSPWPCSNGNEGAQFFTHLAAFTGVNSVVIARGTVSTYPALQVERGGGGSREVLLALCHPKDHRGRTGRWCQGI